MGIGAAVLLALLTACRSSRPVQLAEDGSLEGVLTLVYGDPAPPAVEPRVIASLTDSTGRTWQLLPDSAATLTTAGLRRFDRVRVRVIGRFSARDTLLFRVMRIDSMPQPHER